ncbi:MAG: diguanylate cyclase [Negativicutes bacterium]|nr:diguanylate cyclase [Negativicutes bacterium]MDR3591884.1 diguanylate cyclase [Negativicutes bacterium]
MKASQLLPLSDDDDMDDIVSALPGVVYRVVARPYGRGIFSFLSRGAKELLGVAPEEAYQDIRAIATHVHPEDRRRYRESVSAAVKRTDVWCFDFRVRLPDGGEKWVQSTAKPQRRTGGTVEWTGMLLDITGRKRVEADLRRLGAQDELTGLYNRSFFETVLRRDNQKFAGALIVFDIDGLKRINVAFGYAAGDKLLVAAADIIKLSLRDGDIAARIGGDEFIALLPGASEGEAGKIARAIREGIVSHGLAHLRVPFSVAVGVAVAGKEGSSLLDACKAAEESMGREKLHHAASVRSNTVQALGKALEARDYSTEGHASRLQGMALMLAMAAELPEDKFGDLRLLALFHDIGKVAIPDDILFKPGPLTDEERVKMRNHCEIGHRMASGLPDLAPIAEWILKHHEWWNGDGYPLGLSGGEIPLECRIIAIVDAYDAMINERPYRSAMSHREAIAELRRHSGCQFDALLVDRFVNLVEGRAQH